MPPRPESNVEISLPQHLHIKSSFDSEDSSSHSYGDNSELTAGLPSKKQLPPDNSGTTPFHDGDDENEEEEEKLLSFLTGMKKDLIARRPYYNTKGDGIGDWGRPASITKVFNATIFAFVIQLIPALIFAELLDRQTEGNLATAETLLGSAIIGIIYAVFSGQPLAIIGITGPVALLLGTSYGLASRFGADYFPFFFWTCCWAGLLHVLSAATGLVGLVWKVTPFTTQIFELFTAISFIYSALGDLIGPIHLVGGSDVNGGDSIDAEARSAGYATFLLGMTTCGVAWTLQFAETWFCGTRDIRAVLASYNTLIAVVVATALSYLPGVDQNNSLRRVSVVAPWDGTPTAERAWMVDPFQGIDLGGILGAALPGFMFFLLFIIDHNVSTILTQAPRFNLKKPPAYHWDFFVLGLTFVPCAVLGLPPGNGLLPQAPLHCRALCTVQKKTDEHGLTSEVVTHCEEQRWSGLGQALLVLASMGAFGVLSKIPTGCLFGLLLYLGISAVHGNAIWQRLVWMSVGDERDRPRTAVVRCVRWPIVQKWTLLQLALTLIIWAIGQHAPVGYIYPLLLTLLVPLRSYVLGGWFEEEDLRHLDPVVVAASAKGSHDIGDEEASTVSTDVMAANC